MQTVKKDNFKLEVKPLAVLEALSFATRLAKMIGPGLATLAGQMEVDDNEKDFSPEDLGNLSHKVLSNKSLLDTDNILNALTRLLHDLDEEEVQDLCLMCLKNSTVRAPNLELEITSKEALNNAFGNQETRKYFLWAVVEAGKIHIADFIQGVGFLVPTPDNKDQMKKQPEKK